jgi:hypothetical protein
MQVTRHDSRRVTPFGHPGITARLTTPPGLSRPPTSFIGPWCQGIHRPPLPTYPHTTTNNTHHNNQQQQQQQQDARVHYANLNPQPTHHHTTTPGRRRGRAWHRNNNPAHPPARHAPARPGLFPQNPNRVPTTPPAPPPQTPFPTTPHGDGRTRSPGTRPGRRSPVPPPPHHTPPTPPPGPAHGMPHGPRTQLLRQRVSLERR